MPKLYQMYLCSWNCLQYGWNVWMIFRLNYQIKWKLNGEYMNKPSIRICRIDMILIACTCIFCVIVKYFVSYEIILMFLLSGRDWHFRCIWTCYWKHYFFCYCDYRLLKLRNSLKMILPHMEALPQSLLWSQTVEIVSTFTFWVEKFCEHVTWFCVGKTHPTTYRIYKSV